MDLFRNRIIISCGCLTLLLGAFPDSSHGGAHSTFPTKSGEFRGAGGGALVCIMAGEKGKPPPSTYIGCLHIGAIRVGQDMQETEKRLGKPERIIAQKDGKAVRVYLLPNSAGGTTYFAITYKGKNVVAVQLTGASTTLPYAFSSVRLGDSEKRVAEILGAPRIQKTLKNQTMFWDYTPFPISLELKNNQVYSIRIAENH